MGDNAIVVEIVTVPTFKDHGDIQNCIGSYSGRVDVTHHGGVGEGNWQNAEIGDHHKGGAVWFHAA